MNLIEIKPHAWGCSFLHVDSFLKRCNEHSQSSMSSSQPDRAFPTSDIRFTRIDDLSNGDVHDFIRELEQACGIRAVAFTSLPLMHFLMQCLYPTGDASKRVPISTAHLAVAPALDSTARKLADGDLRTLCMELSIASGRALEFYSGSKLAPFLNKTLPKLAKPKKLTARQSQLQRIALQRRANRR
jgi:hypothetical protein